MKNTTLLSCLYPNKCAACGEIIEENRTLCDYCSIIIDNIDYKKFCNKCGCEEDYCKCKYSEFHFKGIACVYKGEGIAKRVYYSYKLAKTQSLADFFAQKAVAAVGKCFGDLKFDAVCAVPTAIRSRLKRGFDHTGIIAARIAEKLNVEYLNGVLKSRHFRHLQHNSTFLQRLENVYDKYYTVKRINKNRILLFDDICTSRATLDACAKELLFAGAQEVYCVTVLTISEKKKKDGMKNNGN